MELKGSRVVMRAWRKSDAAELFRIANNIKIAGNMVYNFPYPYSLKDAESWIRMANVGEKKGKNFAIEFEGVLVGGAGFDMNKDLYEGTATGGYWLGEEFWGKGIATEAWGVIRDYVFENFNIRRLGAWTCSWNPVSMRVQEKCGFKKESCLRKAIIRLGRVGDMIQYGMTREDWEVLKK